MKRDLSISRWKLLVTSLSDAQLLDATHAAAGTERERTAWLVAHLAEVFRRDLALQRGFPSIYKYAREELKLSESQAWERVSAARLALEIPETIERIGSGELTLDSAGALWRATREKKPVAPRVVALQAELMETPVESQFEKQTGTHVEDPGLEQVGRQVETAKPLLESDKREMFTRVLGKSRRESETALREWKEERGLEKPKPKTRTISFELTDEELAQLDRLRDLLSHKLNSRDPKAALLWMIESGLEKVDPVRKEARTQTRKSRGEPSRAKEARATDGAEDAATFLAQQETVRHEFIHERIPLPEPDRRFIWIRDEGRCRFRDPLTGRICGETAFLDIDHIREVRNGGTNARENLRLACRAHNRRRHRWQ